MPTAGHGVEAVSQGPEGCNDGNPRLDEGVYQIGFVLIFVQGHTSNEVYKALTNKFYFDLFPLMSAIYM